MEKFIILIGGAPTVGKSTLTKKLSKYFDIPWISTDQINSILKSVADKNQYPDLFNSEMSGEEFLTKYSKDVIVEMENKQSKVVWNGITAFVNGGAYPWKSYIIEGVAILPELIHNLKTDKKIIPVFLVDEDPDRIREVVFNRGLFGPAKSYSDSVKEKEIEWCQEFSKQLRLECRKYDLEYFQVSKNDQDFEKIAKHIEEKINI